MEHLALIIYLIDFLCVGTFSGFILFGLIPIGCLIIYWRAYTCATMDAEDTSNTDNTIAEANTLLITLTKYPVKTVHVVFITYALFSMLTPSKETAYKILAVYAGTQVLQTDAATELGSKSIKVLNKILDEYIEEDSENETKKPEQ